MSNTPQTILSFTGVGLAALMLSRCAEDVLPSLKPKPKNDDELLQGTIDLFDKFEKASAEAMCNTPAYENAATLARWLRELKARREKDKR